MEFVSNVKFAFGKFYRYRFLYKHASFGVFKKWYLIKKTFVKLFNHDSVYDKFIPNTPTPVTIRVFDES